MCIGANRAAYPSTLCSSRRAQPCVIYVTRICNGTAASATIGVPSHIAIVPCLDSARHDRRQNCAVAHQAPTDAGRWLDAALPIA